MSRPFAVPSELVDFMREPVPEATAKLNLAIASGSVRGYVHWCLSAEFAENKRVRVQPGQRSIWLPTLNLRSVVSLLSGAVPLVEVTHFDWFDEGRITLRSGAYTSTVYTVSYHHGYLDDHPAVAVAKGVVLNAAARLCDNPTSHRSESTGSEAVVAAGAGGDVVSVLSEGERRQLDPWALPDLG